MNHFNQPGVIHFSFGIPTHRAGKSPGALSAPEQAVGW
ncbi:MAG: hypothetical protein [Olavius algarvensis Delta 4 endosymbiont]|nr:MAG: hypothetical protein [Olavius algarvensis Delta 4 endosymbiont]